MPAATVAPMVPVAGSGLTRGSRKGWGRIDQFVPTLHRDDAIGNHALALRDTLRDAGYESELFYEYIGAGLSGEAAQYTDCDPKADPGRLILYHLSTRSPMAAWLVEAARGGQAVAVDYHNVTPSEFFARWDPHAAESMDAAREEMALLAPWVSAGFADSEYNRQELEGAGYGETAVCPLLMDLEGLHVAPDPATGDRLGRSAGPLWLFVGRLAPNKCQHDVIAAFALYHRLYAPDSRLALIGSTASLGYSWALKDLVEDLDVSAAVDLVGPSSLSEMLAYLERADVFVCLSEHEGFCIPVIEAMEMEVPVVAYDATAVGDTVADAGVVLADKDPVVVAAAVHETLRDPSRVEELRQAGRRRAADFAKTAIAPGWVEALAALSRS